MATRTRSRKKPAAETKESVKRITVTPFKHAEEQEEVERDIHVFETEPAYVRVSAGQTINMGDFESLRIDVAITMPCYAEMVTETQEQCADWVADKLEEEVEKYTGESDGEK